MDYFDKLVRQIALGIFFGMLFVGGSSATLIWLALTKFDGTPIHITFGAAALIIAAVAFLLSRMLATMIADPLHALWQAILHVSPDHYEISPPDLNKIRLGKELVTSLALQVYQLASTTKTPAAATMTAKQTESKPAPANDTLLQSFPVPVFVMDKDHNIVFANPLAATFINKSLNEIVGNNLYSVLDLAFSEEETFDVWLGNSRASKVTAERSWSHVRLTLPDQRAVKQLDMAAYYNKNNPSNAETIIALFDKTADYGKDDDGMSFVAMAVHELRTPLTILRGYIEVFDEELKGKLDPEMAGFVKKMQASSQQLSTFVTNILHVARVESDQLFLQLHEENWQKSLTAIVNDMALRAQVRGKKIELSIQPNIPPVAIDAVSMYEVMSNLIDNAIKYSANSDRIIIRSYLRDDGMIETTVQDFGIGIPSNIIGNLFEKFYRNHRSRASVGGTGLGLYLSKAIVSAHGGQIWVKSKEGEGSIFGFTLSQYSKLAEVQKTADNTDIKRVAHGWIKNHSFYKR